MIQYLVILLDDTSVSYCHYPNKNTARRLMPLETLKAGILFGMKENLNIQFVYPDYDLPREYKDAIETIDHVNIASASAPVKADVVVMNGLEDVEVKEKTAYVIRITKSELFVSAARIGDMLARAERVNIVLTDVETFTEDDFKQYENCLAVLSAAMESEYVNGRSPQLNILTDRMMLEGMNNCGAGVTNITLAPDGCFYVCPAFYQSPDGFASGSIASGVDVKNAQLFRLDHAPLCRRCDAYQCKRCVWLNRKTTYEVNTPSREQCIVAHLERNASRTLLANIRRHGAFLPGKEIKEIDYLDPFDIKEEW
ncbi:MAG: CXXX repeat peptide maturase [Prevotella sp.]|nr:CXXX repeat peptide maturase [Prevotella sp.]